MQARAPQTGSCSVQIRWISNMLHNHTPSTNYSQARVHNSKVNSTANRLRKLTWGNVDRKLLQLSDMNSIAVRAGMCLGRFLYMCIPDSTRTQVDDQPSSRKLEYYTSHWPWITFDHVTHQVRTCWSGHRALSTPTCSHLPSLIYLLALRPTCIYSSPYYGLKR